MTERVSYTVHYDTDRPCDVVYVIDAVRRVSRQTPIATVEVNVTRWFGSHDNGTRGFETLSTRTLSEGEY